MTSYWIIKVNNTAVDCQSDSRMTWEQAENTHIESRVSIAMTLNVLGYRFTEDYLTVEHDEFTEFICEFTTQKD